MATKAQIQANRRNAQKSTGPRTPEGQARSSRNALKHGIRAQAVLEAQCEVLGEDPAAFAAFLQALADDLHPVGPLEDLCVETIALAYWRQRRILLAEMGYIAARQAAGPNRGDPAARACASLPDLDILEKLMRYEARLDRQVNTALARLADLQDARSLSATHDPLLGSVESLAVPPFVTIPEKDDLANQTQSSVTTLHAAAPFDGSTGASLPRTPSYQPSRPFSDFPLSPNEPKSPAATPSAHATLAETLAAQLADLQVPVLNGKLKFGG